MRIAVNTRFLLSDYLEGYGTFLEETLSRITRWHPEHEFIFIFDRPYDNRFIFSDNIKAVVAGPPARHPILWKLWYDVSVPALLRKLKADVFVSTDGFCSLTTSKPQCLVVHDLSFLHFPAMIPRSHYYYLKYYTGRFISRARSLATVSQFSLDDIIRHYPQAKGKGHIIYSAASNLFKPVSQEIKEQTRQAYTDGREYFIYVGSIHPRKNMMNLLKAFSIFKRRQKSNLKLVIVGRFAWQSDKLKKSLESYRYRDDLVLTGYIPEDDLANLIGSAYALLYPSLWEGFGLPLTEGMQCGIPVITSSGTAMEEIAGGAALLANPSDINDIADKMQLIYKDERLKADLGRRGLERAAEFTWDRTARGLWEAIEAAMNKLPLPAHE